MAKINANGKTHTTQQSVNSTVKVRERTPLTLFHFDHFFEVLPNFADSEYSWTVDLTERKLKAAEEVEPFKKQAQAKEQAARKLKRLLDDLKKAEKTQAIRDQIADLTTQHKIISKEGRRLRAKAKASACVSTSLAVVTDAQAHRVRIIT